MARCLKKPDIELLMKADLDNPAELGDLISKIQKPKWWEYPRELFYSSILSGIGTHGRNAVGNALFGASQIPVRIGRALVDAPLSKLTGKQRSYYLKEVMPALHGMKEGLQEGLTRFRIALTRGVTEDLISSLNKGQRSGKFDVPRSAFARAPNRFVREKVAPLVDIPFRLLSASDELFKGINRGMELRALATRSGIEAGLEGDALARHVSEFLSDPPLEALQAAIAFERKMTFTNPLGPFGKRIEDMKNASPLLGYLIPFVRTPVNIFKRGIEFTPANLPRALLMAKQGAPEAAEELTKVGLGTTLMAIGLMKSAAGEMTGPPPREAGERDAFYQQGKQPYSMRVGDNWYSFSQVEPLAMPLAMVASVASGLEGMEPDATGFEKMTTAFGMLISSQLDRSYLSGLSEFMELSVQADPAEALTRFGGRQIAAAAVPFSGFSRSMANLIDPRIVEKESIGDYFREIIPVLKSEVPSRKTRFGEDVRKTRWQAAGPSGTPLVPSRVTDDEVEVALEELGLRVGFPGKSISGQQLDREEYRKFLATVGPRTKQLLAQILYDDTFRRFDTASQQKVVDRMVAGTRDRARAEALLGLVPGIPPLYVKKELSARVDQFNRRRSNADGISARYNETARRPGSSSASDLLRAKGEAEEAWKDAFGGLTSAARDARRRGLSDQQIIGILRRRGVSDRLARAAVTGSPMSFEDYQTRR